MVAYIYKGIGILLIVLLVLFMGGLSRVFEKTPSNRENDDKGYIAFGILSEAILIIVIAIKIITG